MTHHRYITVKLAVVVADPGEGTAKTPVSQIKKGLIASIKGSRPKIKGKVVGIKSVRGAR